MYRTKILQEIINTKGYKRYLEIGTETGWLFNQLKVDYKVGVDPSEMAVCTHKMTSDDFFKQNKEKFDFIFIDGLHHAEQVKKDIANALKVLSKGGIIMMHDCLPSTKEMQDVPRTQKEWTGDCWKAFVYYRRRKDLKMLTIGASHGLGCIRRGRQEALVVENPTYEEFVKNQKTWLNLKTPGEFETMLKENKI